MVSLHWQSKVTNSTHESASPNNSIYTSVLTRMLHCICSGFASGFRVSACLTSVHAGEHEAQGSHGSVWWRHVDSVHTEFDQRFSVNTRQLFWQQEALQTTKHTMIDDRGSGVLTGRHHHTTQLEDKGRTWILWKRPALLTILPRAHLWYCR